MIVKDDVYLNDLLLNLLNQNQTRKFHLKTDIQRVND